MDTNIQHFKELLEGELVILEKEISGVARINPDNKEDWEGVEPEMNTDSADDGEVADTMSEFSNNNAVTEQLELRLNEVKAALDKIEEGTYGVCEECEAPIEEDRLEANPAAKTCKLHM
ncbi:MAG: TraR/DksA C4-type zinc finger protein [Patescibacteria group bacterium]